MDFSRDCVARPSVLALTLARGRRGTVAVSGPPTLVTIETGCHPTLSGLTSTVLAADGARVLAQAASMRRGLQVAGGFAEQERARLQKQLDGR